MRTLKELLTPVVILVLVGVILYDQLRTAIPSRLPLRLQPLNGVARRRTLADRSRHLPMPQRGRQRLRLSKGENRSLRRRRCYRIPGKQNGTKVSSPLRSGRVSSIILPEGTGTYRPREAAQVGELAFLQRLNSRTRIS